MGPELEDPMAASPISQQNSPYLERYLSDQPKSPSPDSGTSETYEEFWQEDLGLADAEAYTEVESEDFANGRPEDSDLLAQLEGDLPELADDGQYGIHEWVTEELNHLKSEIAKTDAFIVDPQAKETLLKKIEKFEKKAGLAGSEDQLEAEFEAISNDFEEQRVTLESQYNKEYGAIKNLTDFINQDRTDELSLESVLATLEENGLSKTQVKNLTYPLNTQTSKKLFAALKAMDPQLENLLSENPNNPFADPVKQRLTSALNQLFPEVSLADTVHLDNFITAAVDISWPTNDEIQSQLGRDHGGNSIDNNSLNSEANAVEQVMRQAMESGDFSSEGVLKDRLYNTDWDGGNWDRGNKGNAFRRWLGAIYGAADKNPALFKAMLKQHLPENILRQIQEIFQDGGHHDLKAGDLLNTDSIRNTLVEVLDMPAID